MNDTLLSQDLADYDQATRDKINAIIAEEGLKTKAMLANSPEPGAILIGSVGAPDGIFGAVSE